MVNGLPYCITSRWLSRDLDSQCMTRPFLLLLMLIPGILERPFLTPRFVVHGDSTTWKLGWSYLADLKASFRKVMGIQPKQPFRFGTAATEVGLKDCLLSCCSTSATWVFLRRCQSYACVNIYNSQGWNKFQAICRMNRWICIHVAMSIRSTFQSCSFPSLRVENERCPVSGKQRPGIKRWLLVS